MEVLVAMTIVGILTAIAVPNYMAYIARGNRAEARAALVEGANWMERWRTERGRYDDPANANNPPPTFPWAQVPRTGTAKYTVAVAATPVAYTITATATGTMTGDAVHHAGDRPGRPAHLYRAAAARRKSAGTAERARRRASSWHHRRVTSWPAVLTIDPIGHAAGTVRMPGSKSISNRALLLAALARGSTLLVDLLDADDTRVMREALSTLGVPHRSARRRPAASMAAPDASRAARRACSSATPAPPSAR